LTQILSLLIEAVTKQNEKPALHISLANEEQNDRVQFIVHDKTLVLSTQELEEQ